MKLENFFKYLPNALNINNFKATKQICEQVNSYQSFITDIYSFQSCLKVAIRDYCDFEIEMELDLVVMKLTTDLVQFHLNETVNQQQLSQLH